MYWKIPPIEKIYEAYSVMADNRFEQMKNGNFLISSSAGDKFYKVKFRESASALKITSDDNASRWQGYAGYPIIAVLMILNRIKFDHEILTYFKGIEWNKLNKMHNNNYSAVVEIILSDLHNAMVVNKIKKETNSIYDQIRNLELLKFKEEDNGM